MLFRELHVRQTQRLDQYEAEQQMQRRPRDEYHGGVVRSGGLGLPTTTRLLRNSDFFM